MNLRICLETKTSEISGSEIKLNKKYDQEYKFPEAGHFGKFLKI